MIASQSPRGSAPNLGGYFYTLLSYNVLIFMCLRDYFDICNKVISNKVITNYVWGYGGDLFFEGFFDLLYLCYGINGAYMDLPDLEVVFFIYVIKFAKVFQRTPYGEM